jgi:hypothetical protein
LKCARTLDGAQAVQAYEAALALYTGDLLDAADVPNYRWMYDNAQIALTLRSDYQRMHRESRLHLADLLAAGDESGLARAAQLYTTLCGEDPEDESLWIARSLDRQRADDELPRQGGAVRALGSGWLEWRWVEKPSGKKFGPYVYYRWRDGGRKRTKYVGKVGRIPHDGGYPVPTPHWQRTKF